MRRIDVLAAGILILNCQIAGAQTLRTVPSLTPPAASQPATTRPIDPKIKSLITQLNDDDPRQRDAAVAELRKLGPAAIPALQLAMHDENPQIRTSAEELVAEQTHKEHPEAVAANDPNFIQFPQGLPPGIILRGGALHMNNLRMNGQFQVRMSVVSGRNATKEVSVDENGNKIHILENKDGVTVDLGEGATKKSYTAKTPDELKEKQPDAFKVYERYMKGDVAGMKIRMEP